MRRAGLLGAAIAFVRSERGQRMIADARRKYDTPANRAKLTDTVANLRSRAAGGRPPARGR
jgi:hypothetical protein